MSHLSNARDALRDLCRAIERHAQDDFGAWSPGLWDGYVTARASLGDPVIPVSGGPEGSHFHFLGFDPQQDECPWCDDDAPGAVDLDDEGRALVREMLS